MFRHALFVTHTLQLRRPHWLLLKIVTKCADQGSSHKFASNIEIIDLCSDSEDNTNLCLDTEDNSLLCLDRKENLRSDDPNEAGDQSLISFKTPFGQNNTEKPISLDDDDWLYSTQPYQSLVSLSTPFGQNNTEKPISLADDDWFYSSTQTSSCYRPAENRCATDRRSKLDNMDIGPGMQNSSGQHRTFPNSWTRWSHPFSMMGGNNIESACHRAPAVSAHRIYPSSSSLGMLHDSSHSNSQKVSTENDDDDAYMYTDKPQSFPTNHSRLSGIRIKEDPTAVSNGFERSFANGIGMSSATVSTGWGPPFNSSQKIKTDNDNDDVYAYEGLRSHSIFPPSVPSWNSVNDVEVPNGLDKQSHPNLENRLPSCDERAVYQEALQHISQEKREEDLPEGVMSVSLLKHQRIALAWMISKEKSLHCPGGILADDQGLGKTISMIALIQKERFQQSKFMCADSDRTKSESLNLDEDGQVVMVMNKKELKGELSDKLGINVKLCASRPGSAVNRTVKTVKVEPKKTRVSLPSSTSTLRSDTRPAAGTLVVCPASILKQWASEISAKVSENFKLSVLVYHGGARTTDPTELIKYDVVVTTYTIVGIEVPKPETDDNMEQENSEMYGVCPEFSIGNKIKLPNKTKKKANKEKPHSSEADLDGGPLARVRWFRVVLDEAQTIKNYQTKSARACCGLRAERRWCLSGTPMQNTIVDLYSYFRFLKYEPYSDYSSFCSMIKYPTARGASQGYMKLQAVLKIVLLRRTKETLLDGEPIIKLPPKTIQLKKINFTQEERYFYLELEEGSRQKFKNYAAAGTIKQNYTNILLLLLRLRQACDHPILLREDHQSNLIDNCVLEMVKQLPEETVRTLLGKLEVRSPVCLICKDPALNAVVATCTHVFCHQCILERLSYDDDVCPVPLCSKKISAETVFSRPILRLCISDELKSRDALVSCAKLESRDTLVSCAKLEFCADLESCATSCSAAADESSLICESYISSKIQAAIDILNSIFNTHALPWNDAIEPSPSEIAPSKAIVFSQWTGMLDLLERSLTSSLIQFRRLDGSMSLDIRETAVKEFKTDPEVRVMLMSLKAGNLGLNMIAACHVIMLDPWWNPFAEDQAVDRAHRIGQTRPVNVIRLTIKDTVEDRILALQEKKRKMVQSVFGDDSSGGSATRLTVEDLEFLFNV